MEPKVAAGGSSTIYGVLYQMLWSLFQTIRLVVECSKDSQSDEIVRAFLRLEPIGGGGDVQVIEPSGIVVDQTNLALKAAPGR